MAVSSVCKLSSCVKDFVYDNKVPLVTLTALAAMYKTRKMMRMNAARKKWDSAGKDVVVLHAGGHSKEVPHASPFVMKVDAYLKMAGIPFVHDSKKPYGPKGKMPWITINGQDLSDSQLIMDHLGKKFGKDFSIHLSPEEKAVARAMRLMVEEHLLWGIAWWRFVADKEFHFMKMLKLPWIATPILRLGFVRRKVQSALWAQGLGRHSDTEKVEMMMKDIEAISVYLGNKPFLMGDKPCEVDCAMFGFFSVIFWGLGGNPYVPRIMENYRNIHNYTIRMKEHLYPDWEDRLWKPKK